MTTAKAAPRSERGVGLPPVTVARFEAASRLLEQLADENLEVFVGRMHEYRETHRSGTDRQLTPLEAASIASHMAEAIAGDEDAVDLSVRLQQSDLRAYDEPSSREVLMAAGVATAPAFIDAALRLVALLELPPAVFEAAYDADTIEEALTDPVAELRKLPLGDARSRTQVALDHLGEQAGVGSGEALRLVAQGILQALNQAAQQIAGTIPQPSSSLTGSLEPTAGADVSASTDSE